MNYRLFGLLLVISSGLTAQNQFFSPHVPKSADGLGFEQKITPNATAYYAVAAPQQLAKTLRNAPLEQAGSPPLLLSLPSPTGKLSTFRIVRYQMIADELQAKYPNFVTAFGWDVDAPNRKVFLEWTDLGFGASVTGGEEGRWYVAPQYWQRQDLYQSYFTKDYPPRTASESCGYKPDPEVMAEIAALGPLTKSVGDCQLREYDLALACTGEYYAAVGGTEALVVSEMMTAVNRVNEVFRADLAITLKIINLPVAGGGIELVFNNPMSDPYDNLDVSAMLGQNQTTIDNVIGSANYDIGHVFSTSGGGIAALGSPCSGASKAQGVTGLPNPTGDPFYIDFVAHEIGHQFGGRHTFNSTNEACAMRIASTAYEPGSGTTIMAYAGICGSVANVQLNSDPYYHAISIQEISAYMELGGGASCANVTATSNGAPTLTPGADFTIPANTPFVLTAAGTDGDGDALTYCWEQFDLGPTVPGIPTGNETQAPLFRSLPPTTSPQRYFPNLPDLVASGSAQWEVLPRVARDLNFVVTLRDFGAAGYGCTVQDEVEVTVVTSAGFAVNSPNGGESWQAGSMETVTWNVAGTGNGTVVDCENVELLLSTNGGLTFDQVIATVPNTGSANVVVPGLTETDVRLMIRCSDNIFFDISDADFSIVQNDFSYTVINGAATGCDGTTSTDYSFELASVLGYTGTINYSATNLPAGAGISFSPPTTTLTANASQIVDFTVNNLASVAAGDYTFQVITDDGNNTKSEDYTLIIKGPLAAPTLILPADNGFTPVDAASFTWNAVPEATSYRWVLCRNANCSSFFNANTTSTGVVFDLSDDFANGDGPFEWFVIAFDDTCSPIAETSSTRFNVTFGTAPPTGNSLAPGNSPIAICEGSNTDEVFTVSFFDADLTGPASLTVLSAPAGLQVLINPATLSNNQTATISFSGEENLSPGDYTITVRANDGTATEDVDFTLTIEEDAVDITSPVDGEEVQLMPNTQCPNGNVTFITFDFNPYTGGGTVNQYVLYIELTSSGFDFPSNVVTPGGNNTFGYCVDEGTMLTFYIEAELADGSTVRSCDRTVTATNSPLPVEWLTFAAQPIGKTSFLEWSVVQDAAHAAFTVERQLNGDNTWQAIDRIERLGTDGVASYAASDPDIVSGNTYFYRIRQEDLDGATDYSTIRSVTFSNDAEVIAFPNPTNNLLNLAVGTDLPEHLGYQLFSALGQELSKGQLPQGQTVLDLGELPQAIYQLVISDERGYRQVIRVVKR